MNQMTRMNQKMNMNHAINVDQLRNMIQITNMNLMRNMKECNMSSEFQSQLTTQACSADHPAATSGDLSDLVILD